MDVNERLYMNRECSRMLTGNYVNRDGGPASLAMKTKLQK